MEGGTRPGKQLPAGPRELHYQLELTPVYSSALKDTIQVLKRDHRQHRDLTFRYTCLLGY